jgi:hypothetical protein
VGGGGRVSKNQLFIMEKVSLVVLSASLLIFHLIIFSMGMFCGLRKRRIVVHTFLFVVVLFKKLNKPGGLLLSAIFTTQGLCVCVSFGKSF